MGIAVGIDLGTSNSVVATVRDGIPESLADREGRVIQPSVVAFGQRGSVVVGHRARQQLVYSPEKVVFSAKRLIGRRFRSPEVERMRSMVAWGITEGPHHDVRLRVEGKVYAVPEISAHVLAHMKQIAEEATGEKVDGAVITVPAYFNDHQRQATRDAAEIAGLDCLRIINEPTAAALAYGAGHMGPCHVAVYDLGGGTFDISILRVDEDLFEVVSTAGDTFLGGDDFDQAIAEHLISELQRQTGFDVHANYRARAKLRDAAERAKCALSKFEAIEVKVPELGRNAATGETLSLQTMLDRNLVRRLCMPLVQRTFVVCDDALNQANLAPSQIDQVLLVGGMTRMPLVRASVGQYFGCHPVDSTSPDEVVALGAALQAHNLSCFSEVPSSVLIDVTPHTLGVRTAGGFVEPIIGRNASIPTEASKIFHTARDNQTEVRVQVFQGESRMASDNELLGEFVLAGLRPAPRGEVRIRITFAIDADGIVHAEAEDLDSGRRRDIRIEASSNLTDAEIASMRFDESQAPVAG